jgi:hypothetical protein
VPLFPRIGFDISGAIIYIVKGISTRSCYDLFVWRHYVIQMPLILLSPGNYTSERENGQSAGFSEEVRSELRGEFLFLADTLAWDVSIDTRGIGSRSHRIYLSPMSVNYIRQSCLVRKQNDQEASYV